MDLVVLLGARRCPACLEGVVRVRECGVLVLISCDGAGCTARRILAAAHIPFGALLQPEAYAERRKAS